MNRKVACLLSVFWCLTSFSQTLEKDSIALPSSHAPDLKYREDQFYFGVTHSMLQDKPKGFSPRTLSLGVQLGFLRDFPINEKRTIALAPGVGYSYFNLHNNLAVTSNNEFVVMDSYNRNAQNRHYIDFPLELRWRTSTPDSHKFWRVYLGVKASYLLSNRNSTSDELGTSFLQKNKVNLNKWTYSMYVSAGFNTWNVYLSYGLNTIYKDNLIENEPNKLRYFNAGLMFYIL